jgi:hypothetical protein
MSVKRCHLVSFSLVLFARSPVFSISVTLLVQISAAHDRSEINAGRELPAQSAQSPTKAATPKRVLNKAAAHAKAFASRAEEGEFLGKLAYQDR